MLCGACDRKYGKIKSGACTECRPRWFHAVVATFLAIWSAALIGLVLRRALSINKDDVTGLGGDLGRASTSAPQPSQGNDAPNNCNTRSAKGATGYRSATDDVKINQASKSSESSLVKVAAPMSPSTQILCVSEILKVRKCKNRVE